MNQFSEETIFEIKCYVYVLIDPRIPEGDPRRIFYVGKGSGPRCFAHAAAEADWQQMADEPNPKLENIREIRQATGKPPPISIVVHGLGEEQAIQTEAILIKLLRTNGNLVQGNYSKDYDLPVEEIEALYVNPLNESDLGHRVLLVSLNGKPPFEEIKQSQEKLRERVRKSWVISETNADQVEYILGVYNKMVRCVFKVDSHQRIKFGQKKNGKPNWKREFIVSNEASSSKEVWNNRRIVNPEGVPITKFRRQQSWRLAGTSSSCSSK